MEEDDDESLALPCQVSAGDIESAPMLPGEQPVMLAKDVLVDDDVRGPLWVTSYRLLYPAVRALRSVPLMSVQRVERTADWIDVNCRDVRRVRIRRLGSTGTGDSDDAMEELTQQIRAAAFPDSFDALYARSVGAAAASKRSPFDIRHEYARWGLAPPVASPSPWARWRISSENSTFRLCPTYPPYVVVPAAIHDAAVARIAAYRSQGRLPVATWLRESQGRIVALLRSGQPLVGIMNARCTEEEILVREVRASSGKPRLHIFDARSRAVALTNKAAGGGFENIESNYADCELTFLSLPNMHTIRESYDALLRACRLNTEDAKWHSIVEATKWPLNLSSLLNASRMIAAKLDVEHVSCLVHCTDGWDRTPQLVSIAQLLIDPFYRTLDGFIVLIEKDWMQFGHQFARRYGQPSAQRGCSPQADQAPIFTQFLNAVFVLSRQAPAAFEFNATLLLELARHVTSCRFGTFLGNGEGERSRAGRRGASFWDYVDEHRRVFLNAQFDAAAPTSLLVQMHTAPRMLPFWDDFFIALSDEAIDGPPRPLATAADAARRAALTRRADAMCARVLARRRNLMLARALRALAENAQRRQLARAEGAVIVRELISELLAAALSATTLDGASWLPVEAACDGHAAEDDQRTADGDATDSKAGQRASRDANDIDDDDDDDDEGVGAWHLEGESSASSTDVDEYILV